MDEHSFAETLAQSGMSLSPSQLAQFRTYYQLLIETNKQVNLTALTSESDVYLKHFYDSLTLAQAVPGLQHQPLALCDVGAGAGFPSLPLKIMFPQLKVTIVDSLMKRITFLQTLVEALGLQDVQLYHDRAETFGGKRSPHREAYDVVTARAVAALPVLAEFCLPLVKVGGQFCAMKGSRGDAELNEAQTAIRMLGGGSATTMTLTLPETGDPRTIVCVDKIEPTSKRYPRKPGTPAKAPLGLPA